MKSELPTRPFVLDLYRRGFIQGLSYLSENEPVCHYFGGIPFALPLQKDSRWTRARPLSPNYKYGTQRQPAIFTGKTGVCPQPGYKGGETVEDCLQLNVWMPTANAPDEGWPVLFYIHGGFLQVGSANDQNPIALLSQTSCQAIIVSPGYRLNIFGFLASPDLIAAGCDPNCGFWDQRLALQWTHENIGLFGGDASNITVAGYSAGAHSVFHQLAFDLYQPFPRQLIKRAIMWSNSPGLQPRSLISAQEQCDELLSFLGIPPWLSPAEKLSRLHALSPSELLKPVDQIKSKTVGHRHLIFHQYRAVTDGLFVRKSLFSDITNGIFARRLKERNIKLLIGECRDEHFLYATWHPPSSFRTLSTRFLADYPEAGVRAIMKHYCPSGILPAPFQSWQQFFGKIYADIQVHLVQRGFLNQLALHGAEEQVYRYRIEWRAKCVTLPPEWGVTHSSDVRSVWFFGDGARLDEREQEVAKKAYLDNLARFIRGEEIRELWGTRTVRQMRRLKSDGSVDCWNDDRWEDGVALWNELMRAGAVGTTDIAKL